MNRSRLTAVCLAALAVALTAAGCGGDDSDQFREDYNAAVDRLLSSLEKGVDDLRAVASAAKSDNPAEANEAVQDLARSGQEITEAENALKKAVDG